MMIHCKSKDDDLGTHYIDDGKEYTWQFRPKVAFDNTQFSCYVAPLRVARHVQFDAYVNNKFKIIEIKNNVYWKVKSDGVYNSDPSAGMDYLRFKWASGANVA
ncbi:S-protein homolog 24 [Linum perenne]